MNKNKKFFLELESELKACRDNNYKEKVIPDNAIDIYKAEIQLSGLYYLLFYKGFSKVKNI